MSGNRPAPTRLLPRGARPAPRARRPRYHPRLDDLAIRAPALLQILVPFIFFMATFYLGLHIVLARLLRGDRPSAKLWFFSIVTGPLTRPVRGLLPPGTSEGRVRAVSLALYVGLWIASRLALVSLTAAGG